MPTKKTSSEKAPKAKKAPVKAAVAPKEASAKKAASSGNKSSLREMRSELYSLRMKHAMGELKEVHKLRQARRAIARHLTSLHQK